MLGTMDAVTRVALRSLVVVLALAACSSPPEATLPGDAEADYARIDLTATEPAPPDDAGGETLVAEANGVRVAVFRHPNADRRWTSFKRVGAFGTPPVFLVEESRDDWLRVLLPMEPNGSEGWIRGRDVKLNSHSFRIEVDLSARRLTAYRDDEVLLRETVAVGKPSTPTPTGRFFTTVLVKPDDPSGVYGPFAWGLSAYSEALETFAGGDGQVAIHGTNAPWFIGDAVSHGCIRIRNEAIRKLARLLPLGTPVDITR
jgi:lipoprotein-anchoring transpeptidase ErfK/SrfK